jgi:hypothetical protein
VLQSVTQKLRIERFNERWTRYMGLTDQVASFGSPKLCRINEERAGHKGARICGPEVTGRR